MKDLSIKPGKVIPLPGGDGKWGFTTINANGKECTHKTRFNSAFLAKDAMRKLVMTWNTMINKGLSHD